MSYTVHIASSLTTSQTTKLGVSCLVCSIAGALLITATFKSRLVINNDAVEDRGIFRTQRFARSDIMGKKVFATQVGAIVETVVLYPLDLKRRPMKIEMVFRPTSAFDAWMAAIPNIDGSQANWYFGRF